ncbi:hypothetical protein [Allobranchiibius huperziae]|uniref:MmyB family transcriptional regulator n=1 Tax=Allobranchiibius huperziae TaxID=1874116 RepID=UPI001C538054
MPALPRWISRPTPRGRCFIPGGEIAVRDWETIASETVSQLRLMSGRRPDDARIAELVRTLATHGEPFWRPWDTGMSRRGERDPRSSRISWSADQAAESVTPSFRVDGS